QKKLEIPFFQQKFKAQNCKTSQVLNLGFTDQNKKNYVFINQTMSWSSAQQYCRKNYKDLAMIENQEENTEAQNAKPSSDLVWIGLYREPWTWSDGSKSSFRNWYPSGSDNDGGNQHCGTENSIHISVTLLTISSSCILVSRLYLFCCLNSLSA
uniref:C-type lectin domain-containing protein n=1 Tax=Oryzias sinensis TaxID=183150 RepID=A0A8C7X075_9TELE